VKTSNPHTLSNELRALVAATPLGVFLRAARGESHRVKRTAAAVRMQASA